MLNIFGLLELGKMPTHEMNPQKFTPGFYNFGPFFLGGGQRFFGVSGVYTGASSFRERMWGP